HFADTAGGAQRESGAILVWLTVEPSGMDEVQQLDSGRKHPAGKYSRLRAILTEIRGGVRGSRRERARGDHPKRDRRGPGRANAGVSVAGGGRGAAGGSARPTARSERHENLDARPQLQFVGPRAGSTLEAPVQEVCEHRGLARVRGSPGDDG